MYDKKSEKSLHRRNRYESISRTNPMWNIYFGLAVKKPLMMGILNATPDSFSDGGKFNEVEIAVERAKEMVANGADIIDIGGESTRPGFAAVSLEEELERVIPIIKAISEHVHVPISIDTYKAEVAKQAIEAGAHIINDVWGAKADENMGRVAADYGVPIVLMHNRHDRNYKVFMRDVINDLYESIAIVKNAGVKDENIILDPGIGFARRLSRKSANHAEFRYVCQTGLSCFIRNIKKINDWTSIGSPCTRKNGRHRSNDLLWNSKGLSYYSCSRC